MCILSNVYILCQELEYLARNFFPLHVRRNKKAPGGRYAGEVELEEVKASVVGISFRLSVGDTVNFLRLINYCGECQAFIWVGDDVAENECRRRSDGEFSS